MRWWRAAMGLGVIGLAACGGGGGDTATPNPTGNRAPVVEDLQRELVAGGTLLQSLTASDPDGDRLQFSLTSQPSKGTAHFSDGVFVYRHHGALGTDSCTVVAEDGRGGQAGATITLTITNQAPTISLDVERLRLFGDGREPSSGRVEVQTQDTDDQSLELRLASAATLGTVAWEGDELVYSAGATAGSETLTIVVDDGFGGQAEAELTVTVVDPRTPQAEDVEATVTALTPGQAIDLHATVADAEPSLSWRLVDGQAPQYGSVAFNNNVLIYTHTTGGLQSDRFLVEAINDGLVSPSATVTVHFENTAPTAEDQDQEVPIGEVVTINLKIKDDDTSEGQQLGFRLIDLPAQGSIVAPLGNPPTQLNGSDVTFQVPDDQALLGETITFTYVASDLIADSSQATVTMTVTNTAPSISSLDLVAVREQAITFDLPGSDADGHELTWALGELDDDLAARLQRDGRTVTYTAPRRGNEESFTFTVADPYETTDPATVFISLTGPYEEILLHDDPGHLVELEVLDFDGDGDEDLVAVDSRGQVVFYEHHYNADSGDSGWRLHILIEDAGLAVDDMAIAELDGREGYEIALQAGSETRIFQRPSLGWQDWSVASTIAAGGITGKASQLAVVDLDADGALDLVIAGEGSGNVHVVVHYGDGGSGYQTGTIAANALTGHSPTAMHIVDIDGDALLDVVVGTRANEDDLGDTTAGELLVLFNPGARASYQQILRLPELRAVADILPVDFVAEAEGEVPVTELVIAYQNSTFMDWLRFPSVDKNGNFLRPDHSGIKSGLLAVHRVRTLDVDGDGDLDLAAAGQDIRGKNGLTEGPGGIALVINNLDEATTATERWQQHEVLLANGASLTSPGDAWLLEPLIVPGATERVALVAALEMTAGKDPMAHRLVSLQRDRGIALDDWDEVVIAESEPSALRLAIGDADADQRQEVAFFGRRGMSLRRFDNAVESWHGERIAGVIGGTSKDVDTWEPIALGYGELDESVDAPGWEITVGSAYFRRHGRRWGRIWLNGKDETDGSEVVEDTAVLLADLNADGHLDQVSIRQDSDTRRDEWRLHLSVDSGDGVYWIDQESAFGDGSENETRQIEHADSTLKPVLFAPHFFSLPGDGDALPELFFLDEQAGRLLRSPLGTTDFSAVTDFDVVANMNTNGLRELAVGDIIPEMVGEAVDELVMVGENSDWINIFLYDGEQWGKDLWAPRLGDRSDPVGKLSFVSVNDIDSDGIEDIVVAEREGGAESGEIRPMQRIIRFFTDADGVRRSEVLRSIRGQPSDIVLEDIDGDGLLDIVVSTNDNGRVYLLRNNSADPSDG